MLNLKEKSPRGCWLVGHRGAKGHAPENTMSSFLCSLKMGADLVECDVHLSKDRKCVVMHDEGLERTTSGSGLIRDTYSSAIKNMDAGSWFSKKFKNEKVPLLDDLLSWAQKQITTLGRPPGVVIEIKNEPIRYREIEKEVLKSVLKTKMQDRVIIISFDHGVIKRTKMLNPNIAAGILYREPLEDPFERARQVQADALFPRRHLVTTDLVRKAHQKKIALATWTVDQTAEMKKMVRWELDAIATNYPDQLNKILDH